jgi:uncharacterized protein (TIGR00297 family)
MFSSVVLAIFKRSEFRDQFSLGNYFVKSKHRSMKFHTLYLRHRTISFVPVNETTNFIIMLASLTTLVVVADLAKKFLKLGSKTTRMFVHASVAVVIFFLPLLFQNKFYPALLGSIFIAVNFAAARLGMFKGMNADKKNLGTVFYPISFLILVLLLWDKYPFIISTAMLVMGLADPAAAVIGSSLKNTNTVSAFGGRKTFEGAAAMLIVASIAVVIGFLFFDKLSSTINFTVLLNISVAVGIMVAAIELISPKATDNLTVPLCSALLLFIAVSNPVLFESFMVGEFLALIIAVISAKLKLLTKDGAVATFIMGGFIFGFGGWRWSVPLLLFFAIGSLASKLFAKRKAGYNILYEKSHQRDSGQVLANGGLGLILLICSILAPSYHWFLAYLGAISAVTADTLATEFGIFSRSNPFSIPLRKRVEKGISGAVSSLGTFTGFLSAAVLALLTLPVAGGYALFPVRFIIAGAVSGMIGNFMDSLIGGTVQSQYRCTVCNKITERKKHCDGRETALVQGYRWINNDVVNFAASVAGGVTFPLLFFWI